MQAPTPGPEMDNLPVIGEWILKGGALVLLGIVLAYLGRWVPKVLAQMQATADANLAAFRAESALERAAIEKRADADRAAMEARSKAERDSCDARATLDRQAFALRFEAVERNLQNQTAAIQALAVTVQTAKA